MNNLGRGRTAFRAVALLLVVALLTSLAADLRHHFGHAGHSHGAHMQAVDRDVGPVAGTHGSAAQVEHDATLTAADPQPDAHHRHGAGTSSCDCCAATCLVLMHVGTATVGFPKGALAMGLTPSAAIITAAPQSFDRPPIASL